MCVLESRPVTAVRVHFPAEIYGDFILFLLITNTELSEAAAHRRRVYFGRGWDTFLQWQ